MNNNLYDSTFPETCKALIVEARAREKGLANQIRSKGWSTASDDRQCIKDWILLLLENANYKGSNLKVSKEGQFRIYEADYTIHSIDGTSETFSLNNKEKEEMRNIFYSNEEIRNRKGNWMTRLEGLLSQPAGQVILNKGLMGLTSANDLEASKSKTWKWDTEINLGFEYDREIDEQEYKFFQQSVHLEHKENLDYFHFGDKEIILDLDRLSKGKVSLYSILKNILVTERLENNFPIFYSAVSKDVLLSSELLSHPNKFEYELPEQFRKEDIREMAKKINEQMDPEVKAQLREEQFNMYVKDIWSNMAEAKIKTSLFYGK